MDIKKTVIFEIKLDDGTLYEIKSILPSWELTKYIMSNYSKLNKTTIDSETTGLFDEIVQKNFIGWRNGSSEKWIDDYNALPGIVVMSYITALMNQANIRATTSLKIEKN